MCKLDEKIRERKQKNRSGNIKDGVDCSNTDNAYRTVHEAEIEDRIDAVEHDEPYNSSDELDGNMDYGNSLSVPVNADG